MKRVLSVQDLSCLGKCSLTVALPVLSAMGCRCSVLPTAVLSTHTGFPGPHVRPLTEDMMSTLQHWQTIGAEFDVISIGYLSDPAQAAAAEQLIDTFPSFVILDPAMGDHGKLYSGITQEHVQAMGQLCRKARLLLPNLTEAALLTGLPYREIPDQGYLKELAEKLLSMGPEAVVITGASLSPGKTGFYLAARQENPFSYQVPVIPKSFHGTGDLFSAVITGGLLTGLGTRDAAVLAAGFVEKCISSTREVTPFGVDFEAQLPWLWQKMQSTPACTAGYCPGY